MQITVSALGQFWAHQAARALQQEGWLRYWLTGAPGHEGQGVDAAHIRYLPAPAYLHYGLERVLPGTWGQYAAISVSDNLFDLLAARYAAGCDIFHAYNHYGLFSMRRAARDGAMTVVERASAHIVTQGALMREEYAQHGLRMPDTRWPLEWKHIQEYEEADHIIVCSEFVRRTMLEQGVPEDKLSVIPLGVDLATFKPRPDGQDGMFRVMFAGAVSLRKGALYLLEAFKRLAIPDAELLLVGGVAPEMARLLRPYEGQFRFVQGVPQRELVKLYNSASVFVMPSIEDGFGMVVAEAMACGVPVIVSQNVGIPVEDGQQGFVVPIRDSGAIAEKLAYLYDHADARRAMGVRAHAHARQFSWANYQHKLLHLYRSLLGEV
jgi:glycosyltransferase involved in cell wall biosynthesis